MVLARLVFVLGLSAYGILIFERVLGSLGTEHEELVHLTSTDLMAEFKVAMTELF